MRGFLHGTNKEGGLYGQPKPTHKTRCPNSNNPYGHSPDCLCGWADQKPGVDTLPAYKPAPCEDRRGNRCMECADCRAFIEQVNHG